MIIITYFLLLHSGGYKASKSEITPFRLKDTAFSSGYRIFAPTATEGYLQTDNFVTLMFTTQNNRVRGDKI